ncbi:DNA polymerase I [Ornithobacterium rhinotracheale]|uniref:DNA polymerase I n=1 Tax=Ornithobacterium rhinotracheale TaxID=28251 RepID=UPI00129CF406|nr:DNA polymerase I [Ornithobacterium rhinotracheale]MRJ08874.1 DNA polymerase I [Ornithobacterium rhinotracheale]UOH77755.1 DNA polymerase I [Ornithobacterium rhinotracheale]
MSTHQDKRLFLLDAYALIFRGYYAFIKNPRINSKGLNTSAIMGFMNSLLEVVKKEKPTHLAVVFDVGKQNTLRHEYFPEYKATRDETPEGIKVAVPYIQEILHAMKIPVLYAEGYEADDVIGTLARKAEKNGFTTFMMTPDKDFAQLVSEHIKMYKPASRGGGIQIWGVKEVQDNFGVKDPKQIIDYLGMMGDSADNIPGIPGIGPKTAQKFIEKYGSMEGLYENINDLKGKQKVNVEENKEQAFLSKKLATILTDAPVEFDEESLIVEQPDFDKIKEIFTDLEFKRLTENLFRAYGLDSPAVAATTVSAPTLFDQLEEEPSEENSAFKTIENQEHFYQLVDTTMGLKILVSKLLQQKQICLDCETTGLKALEASLVGMAFSYEQGKGYYVSFAGQSEAEIQEKIEILRPVLESPEILKIGQNLKYDIKVLFKYNIQLSAPLYDTMVAHYLINPDMRHNMDFLAETYLNYKPISIETLIGKKGKNQMSFDQVPLDQQTEYAVEDTDVTLQLKETFAPKIEEIKAGNLFHQVEMPLVQVLADMEKEGISLDVGALSEISKELDADMGELEKQIFGYAQEEFNLNSPKQLGEILFEKMQLIKNPKKTKTGQYATSEEILSKIADKHPIIEQILEYRQLQKLKSTYVDSLPQEVSPITGRVHTSFAQTVAATGRLASNNPNLQNIPIRTPRGQEVRKAFIAKDEEHILLAADYSQIELRLIAGLSQDPTMMTSFLNGEDIHAATAAKVFGIPLSEVSREQRSHAKTVNFGIVYGVSAFGLSEQTSLSRGESKDLIDAYFETYPQLQKYIQDQIALARKQGYVETILGRRRYLRDINSNNYVVKSHAERNAVNAPVQGSAADIIKLGMVKIHQRLKQENFQTKMLLQVHDELVFEAPKSEVEQVSALIKDTMEHAIAFNVPLVVECGIGKNWLEAH